MAVKKVLLKYGGIKVSAQTIDKLPLAQLPTPFYKLNRLSEYMGGPEIFIKRDDMTGLGLGGNKIRKLEYVLADAKKKQATVVLTTGGVQSNHCMLTAMAAAKIGLKSILMLKGKRPSPLEGNLVLSNLVSELIFIDTTDQDQVYEAMAEKARELEKSGETPYSIPVGASVPLGALGYYDAFNELVGQAEKEAVKPTHLVHAWGSGGTQGGLVAAAAQAKSDIEIVGINVDDEDPLAEIKEKTSDIATETLSVAGSRASVSPGEINIIKGYGGEEGYGKPSKAGLEAVKTLASHEGILLDPVYTGKAMAGLLDLIKQGYFPQDSRFAFIHTGGYGAIFAFPERYIALGEGK